MATDGTISPFDPVEQWNCYSERLDFYFEANVITKMDKKRVIFLTVVGPATYQLKKPKQKTYPELKELLDQYYLLKPFTIVQCFRFHIRVRQTGESVATYVAALHAIDEHCGFKDTLKDTPGRNLNLC